jgi:hypothetical protein
MVFATYYNSIFITTNNTLAIVGKNLHPYHFNHWTTPFYLGSLFPLPFAAMTNTIQCIPLKMTCI